jgi:xanthine dehydrogenase small subunit
MSTRPIRFWHRGQLTEVHGAAPTRSVLDWLREDAHCSGTKEGCNEGDCGACTVVLGRLDGQGALQLRPVNACIQFLPTLDGQALFTVEDLACEDGAPHPVQQAVVEHHGSQCGFCTPGFVMSLWAQYQQHAAAGTRPTRQALADALSGNLCRCTGYRPILDAGEHMLDAPARRLDAEPVRAALQALAEEPPLHHRSSGGEFHAPRTLDELAATLAARPQAQLLAGSTDIGLWVNKQLRVLPEIVYLGAVPELQRITASEGVLHIGAGASLEAAWQALAMHWPAVQDLWLRFASPLVRSTGTLGGNVANGSPIGDAAPVLMALNATLLLRRAAHSRRLPLHSFYLGYMKNALQPGEFLQAIEVPLPQADQVLRAYKISKRFDCDISAVCAGLALQFDGECIGQARLAFGGMAATVQRAARAEAALQGQPWTEATLQAAQAALAQDFAPLNDLRASAAYRLQVAQNLLRRFWLETRLHDPLPAQALNVWPLRLQPAEAVR